MTFTTIYYCIYRNSYSGVIEFSKVSITILSASRNSEFTVTDAKSSNLTFHAKETKKFLCKFQAPKQSDGSEIRITTISLFMGNDTICCIVLRFSTVGRETNFLSRLYPEIQQLRYVQNETFINVFSQNDASYIYNSRGEFETIQPLVNAEIKQDESSLSISAESNNPALLGEWLPIKISITANENILSALLSVSLVSDGANEQSSTC